MNEFDGVIFDMDGTLVRQGLDFAAIRRALGVRPEEGLLEAIARMEPRRRERAMEYLVGREVAAAGQVELMPGAAETLEGIRAAGLKAALLTRNAPQAMRRVMERFGLKFDLAWSREDGPVKPSPEGILRACRELGIEPARTLCVGDFLYDITAANAAGARSVLLTGTAAPAWAGQAAHRITRLTQVLEILGLRPASA